jgi:hypothetical protein
MAESKIHHDFCVIQYIYCGLFIIIEVLLLDDSMLVAFIHPYTCIAEDNNKSEHELNLIC